MPAARDHRQGLCLVTAAVVAWSSAGLFTRLIGLDAATILFWRGLFGAVGTAALILPLQGKAGFAGFRQLGAGGLGYAVLTATSMLFFISALRATTVAHVAILTATVPLIAAALGWLLLGIRPGRSAILASLAALAGVVAMVGGGGQGGLAGDLMTLAMALCMAGMILVARSAPDLPALPVTAIAAALSALAALPFATIAGLSAGQIGLLALFALINQVMGFGLFALGSRLLPPTETALLTTLEAPLAPLWVWLALSETPDRATLTGGALVFGAVLAHLLRQGRAGA